MVSLTNLSFIPTEYSWKCGTCERIVRPVPAVLVPGASQGFEIAEGPAVTSNSSPTSEGKGLSRAFHKSYHSISTANCKAGTRVPPALYDDCMKLRESSYIHNGTTRCEPLRTFLEAHLAIQPSGKAYPRYPLERSPAKTTSGLRTSTESEKLLVHLSGFWGEGVSSFNSLRGFRSKSSCVYNLCLESESPKRAPLWRRSTCRKQKTRAHVYRAEVCGKVVLAKLYVAKN